MSVFWCHLTKKLVQEKIQEVTAENRSAQKLTNIFYGVYDIKHGGGDDRKAYIIMCGNGDYLDSDENTHLQNITDGVITHNFRE